ncbi:MAG: OmpA family protein [Lachnospiraceae bacterium]|nr:OmpA family protein [Lachnospiraceae bacterium]
MRSKRKNREPFREQSYWQSYSDMMAALLLFFILITAVTMTVYRKKTTDLEQTQKELNLARDKMELVMADLEKSNEELTLSLEQLQQAYDQEALTQEELKKAYLEIEASKAELALTKGELQNIVGIRTDIIHSLQNIFDESSMKVDAQTGSITFSSDVLFRYNSSTLTAQSQKTLKQVIPMYLSVLLQEQYRDYIAEIIIEGHTDTDGTYQSNMELSYNRAYAVASFCLKEKNGLNKQQIEQLQHILTVNGRSYSDPVYSQNSNAIDMAASRRVEIKFRLKEDEMIEKIAEIINRE